MHQSQHYDGDDVAAVATRGPSRQLFYRDRIPPLPSESRDFARTTVPYNYPVTATSDSTDSSVDHYNVGNITNDGTRVGLQPSSTSPSHQLQADYTGSLHKNRLVAGDNAVVVGGKLNQLRENGGTLIEVSEEVYAVRKAALTVLDPITYCWVSLPENIVPFIFNLSIIPLI